MGKTVEELAVLTGMTIRGVKQALKTGGKSKRKNEIEEEREDVKEILKKGFKIGKNNFELEREYPSFYLFRSKENKNRTETILKNFPEVPVSRDVLA